MTTGTAICDCGTYNTNVLCVYDVNAATSIGMIGFESRVADENRRRRANEEPAAAAAASCHAGKEAAKARKRGERQKHDQQTKTH